MTATDAPSRAEETPLERLARLRAVASRGGDPAKLARARERGLRSPRERIGLLLDPGSEFSWGVFAHSHDLHEAERTLGDGALFGFGEIEGRPVAYIASDALVKGGSGSGGGARRLLAFHRLVERCGIPVFDLAQGGGARITEVMSSRLAGFNGSNIGSRRIHPRRSRLITTVLGNYFAPWKVAQADFVVATQASFMSFTSPPVLEEATGVKLTAEELGGAEIHATVTGQLDAVAADDEAAIALARRVFGYLPANPWEPAPVRRTGDPADRREPALREIVPENLARAYDMRKVIQLVTDRDSFLELGPDFARNAITGLARFDGEPVVVIANQPMVMAGAVDVNAALKIDRAMTLANECALPVVTFSDIPGVLTTKDQEHKRLLAHIYGLATTRLRGDIPKVNVVVRKAIGYAYFLMSGGDPEGHTFAWPGAQIAFMGADPAVRVAFRAQLEASEDPKATQAALAAQLRAQAAPWTGARLGYLDDVIDPADTRPVVIRALQAARRQRGAS